jgi:hypothetical protein
MIFGIVENANSPRRAALVVVEFERDIVLKDILAI